MPLLDVTRDLRLHVLDEGSGRPVVLVHGWSLSHRSFAPQTDALRARFRVVAPDLRGHGDSPPSHGPCTVEDLAADLAAIFELCGLEDAVLVGWSWGAEVALAALDALRGRVAHLALISATPRFTSAADWPHGLPEARVRALRARMSRAPGETRAAFVRSMFVDGELADAERERLVAAQLEARVDTAAACLGLEALAAADLRDRVRAGIEVPLLLVHGDRDGVCLPGASAWIHDRVPGSRLAVLAGAGHAPQLSRANEVTALLAELAGSVR